MTKIKALLTEIDQLSEKERQLLLVEIFKRINNMNDVLSMLSGFRGKGKSLWKQDAQEHVASLRTNDRI